MNECGGNRYCPRSRRAVVVQLLGLGAAAMVPRSSLGQIVPQRTRTEATFIFAGDVHACRMASGLSPNCANEGKTDANLLRHIAAVIGVFHGHQHETAMIYRHSGLDLFKPKAAFMGGFAVVHVTDDYLDVVFAETVGRNGEVKFTNAFSKPLG